MQIDPAATGVRCGEMEVGARSLYQVTWPTISGFTLSKLVERPRRPGRGLGTEKNG